MGEPVVNVRAYKVGPRRYDLPANVTYVGRGGGRVGLPRSEFANPHPVRAAPGQTQAEARRDAIDAFWATALARLELDPAWLDPLIGQFLACHCAPLECHADVLAELVGRRVAQLVLG